MLYCENCKRVCVYESDCICACKHLREATEQDYCFLLEANEAFAQMLEGYCDSNGIECVLIPSGNGSRSALGLSLGNFIICVPYSQYAAACEILTLFERDQQEDIRKDLLENRASWHAGKRVQRKLRKKLKMTDDQDFFDCIQNVLVDAPSVTDDGLIGSCEFAGHYIAVRGVQTRFWFNSATYEIFI